MRRPPSIPRKLTRSERILDTMQQAFAQGREEFYDKRF